MKIKKFSPKQRRVKKVVHQALRGGPFPQNKPPVEGAAVVGLIPPDDPGGEGWVVLHSEVQVQCAPLLRLQDPLLIKPVLRPLGVAVEPQP